MADEQCDDMDDAGGEEAAGEDEFDDEEEEEWQEDEEEGEECREKGDVPAEFERVYRARQDKTAPFVVASLTELLSSPRYEWVARRAVDGR